jgi:hypothetical protein
VSGTYAKTIVFIAGTNVARYDPRHIFTRSKTWFESLLLYCLTLFKHYSKYCLCLYHTLYRRCHWLEHGTSAGVGRGANESNGVALFFVRVCNDTDDDRQCCCANHERCQIYSSQVLCDNDKAEAGTSVAVRWSGLVRRKR